jgi:3D (Asp-Asp-Asp) domain-containing protein
MEKLTAHHRYLKTFVWLLGAGFFLASVVAATMVGPWSRAERKSHDAVKELERLGLLSHLPNNVIQDVIDYQGQSGKSLAEILREPYWCKRMGFAADEFKSTWYMSNPYEMLPSDLKQAIRKRSTPFKSNSHVMEWCESTGGSPEWKRALSLALIETTPTNLWRAGQGLGAYVTNGEFIEPIVVDRGNGRYDVKDGHIATDPKIIPTNSVVFLLVKVNGEDRIVKVKAADTGCAIKGKHVDLPIHLSQESRTLPHTLFPKAVSNPTVKILTPIPVLANPGRKAETVSL